MAYMPRPIRTLFVGESRPANGTFFYRGDSNLVRYTCEALGGRPDSDGTCKGFLRAFQARGFYLRDLSPEPVNHLSRSERRLARAAGVEELSIRMGRDRPEAVVVVMKGIAPHVRSAMNAAGLDVPLYCLPFPAMSHQRMFVEQLKALASALPQNSV